MSKLTLTQVASGYESIQAINTNYDLIVAAIENTLSRDGTTPNSMSADLDVNSNQIINLPAPAANNSPSRLQDILDATSTLAGTTTALLTSITDTSSYYTGNNVEAALQELGARNARILSDKAEIVLLTPTTGDVYYIRSDDGRGNIWRAVTGAAASTYSDDGGAYCGTTIIPTGGDGSTAFLRDYTVGEIYARWFGEIADGTTDDTTACQTAIDVCKADLTTAGDSGGGGKVIFMAGIHAITRLTRKSGVSLIGAGRNSTFFVALTLTESDPYGMVEIDDGPIVGSHMRGMTFCGGSTISDTTPTNANQWGMYAHAKWDTGYNHGGLWSSIHEDVEFRHFNQGIWSRAGYTAAHSLRPNQFLKFINCYSLTTVGGESLRLTGQHGQIEFSGGDYSGYSGVMALLAFKCDWDSDPSTTADDSSGHGEDTTDTSGVGNAVRVPENVVFNGGASIQRANSGCYIRSTKNIDFDGTWFETLGGMVELASGGSCTISRSRFANAADGLNLATPSAGNGWLFKQGSNTNLELGAGNLVTGTADNWLEPTVDLTAVYHSKFSQLKASSIGKVEVVNPYVALIDGSGDIDSKGHEFVYIQANATRDILLDTIDSYLTPSEELTMYANTGAITISSSGHIRLPQNVTELTIGKGTFVTLKRMHLYGSKEWFVSSYMNESNSVAPADAYYYSKGTIIENTGVAAGDSPGWITTTAGLAGTTAVFKALADVAA